MLHSVKHFNEVMNNVFGTYPRKSENIKKVRTELMDIILDIFRWILR